MTQYCHHTFLEAIQRRGYSKTSALTLTLTLPPGTLLVGDPSWGCTDKNGHIKPVYHRIASMEIVENATDPTGAILELNVTAVNFTECFERLAVKLEVKGWGLG